MTIENPLFYMFRIDEYYQFSNRVIPIIKQLDTETLGLAGPIDKIDKANEMLRSYLDSDSSVPCNLALIKADMILSDAFMGLKTYLLACQKKLSQEWKVNSRLLIEAIKKYGWWLEMESSSDKGRKIRKFINDIKDLPQLSEAVEKLQMQNWIDELWELLNKLEVVNRSHIEDMPENQICVCTEIRNSYELLFKYIEIMQRIQPNEIFSHIIKDINNVVNEFNSEVRSRKGKSVSA